MPRICCSVYHLFQRERSYRTAFRAKSLWRIDERCGCYIHEGSGKSHQCSEFDVRTTFWSVWTWTWHFNHCFGWTVFGFEAVWTDRLTKLGKVSFVTWLTDRLDVDVAFWKRFGPDKSMVQSGLSLMSIRTWSAIRNTESRKAL